MKSIEPRVIVVVMFLSGGLLCTPSFALDLETGVDVIANPTTKIHSLHRLYAGHRITENFSFGPAFYSASTGNAGGTFFWGVETVKKVHLSRGMKHTSFGFLGGGEGGAHQRSKATASCTGALPGLNLQYLTGWICLWADLMCKSLAQRSMTPLRPFVSTIMSVRTGKKKPLSGCQMIGFLRVSPKLIFRRQKIGQALPKAICACWVRKPPLLFIPPLNPWSLLTGQFQAAMAKYRWPPMRDTGRRSAQPRYLRNRHWASGAVAKLTQAAG